MRLPSERLRIAIAGGGAAGFFAAIACAEANPRARVTLLEAGRQPLSKVRISGGGRCNVTHACFEPRQLVRHYPRGSKELLGCLSRFGPADTVDWFESRGVPLKTEADGRMFPISDRSQSVIDCLTGQAREQNVELRTGCAVVAIDSHNCPPTSQNLPTSQTNGESGFDLTLKSGETLTCDRLVLATGSNPRGYQFARDLGHTIVPPVPSLFTFAIGDRELQALAGIAVESATARLPELKLSQTGPLAIAHWGLTGPAVLKLSAWGARSLYNCGYRTSLTVDWLPELNAEQLRQHLRRAKSDLARKAIASVCPFSLPKRLWQYLLAKGQIDGQKRWTELSKADLNRAIETLKCSAYPIAGKGQFKEEFVTCGGVQRSEIQFKTLESRRCPHLYFAGEILDIDGITGGFNFQNAWTTGWLAGRAAAVDS